MAIYASDIVKQAEAWIGCAEADGSHKLIIDIYNSHKPLARGYKMPYSGAWCATFVSAVAIKCGATDIIPTECGCERMIELFKKLGRWIENENRKPAAGDIIFYDWQDSGAGDNTGWSEHVGIVQKVVDNQIFVIEGNYKNSVAIRKLAVNAKFIRGYAQPKYDLPTANKDLASQEQKLNFVIGEKVKLSKDAVYYNGKRIPAWVKASKLYVREIRKDGFIVISIFKSGAITGAVDKKYLVK
jgi:hypothetical protein